MNSKSCVSHDLFFDCTTLQNDLDKLSIWEQKWKMAFHPDKCNVLSITRNKTPITYSYTLHGHQLDWTGIFKWWSN
jgi:hypothetical protein